jgi:hypothetical protein
MGEWRRGKRDKNKEKEKAEQFAIVHRNKQNQTDQEDRIGRDKAMEMDWEKSRLTVTASGTTFLFT